MPVVPPDSDKTPRILIDDVEGDPSPISEEEAERARTTLDPEFFDENSED